MTPLSETQISRYAWTGLALGVSAQTSGAIFLSTPAFLIPLFHLKRGLSLTQAGAIAAAPSVGIVLTLFFWGVITDRFGERVVLVTGTALTAVAALLAMVVHGYPLLVTALLFGGMMAGSGSSASGKVVMGWFPGRKRGLAMGIRQTAVPLGAAIAAATVPTLAHHGIGPAFSIALGCNAVLAVGCAIGIKNPPRPAKGSAEANAINPYKGSNFLVRIHAVSTLLVVPQFTIATFGLVWLVTQLHYSQLVAGILVAVSSLLGAFGRIAVGVLSDRVGSRVKPLRWVALSAIAVMLLMALSQEAKWQAGAVTLFIASMVTVADNGLAFTSVAEKAGRTWSGRALGVQNTGQNLSAALTAPVVGALIGGVGYAGSFLLVALCPVAAYWLIPQRDANVN